MHYDPPDTLQWLDNIEHSTWNDLWLLPGMAEHFWDRGGTPFSGHFLNFKKGTSPYLNLTPIWKLSGFQPRHFSISM